MNRFSMLTLYLTMIIAIDGPSGAGKGTIAKYLSEEFTCLWIDSGLFYRYFSWKNQATIDLSFVSLIQLEDLRHPFLRTEEIAALASQIAVLPEVREAVTQRIRSLCEGKNAVVDGRDIASHVFPEAEVKLFITARPEIRYQRRSLELDTLSQDGLMKTRDERDSQRKYAPLTAVNDAFVLDTSDMTIEQACQEAFRYVEKSLQEQ